MNDIEKLAELFREFPGIGPRQAKRFVYFLLRRNNGYNGELSKLIAEIKKDVTVCENCFRFFPHDHARGSLCNICLDDTREKETLMLVAQDSDFESIEKTHSYNGYYFILGGIVPILEKSPEKKFRQNELLTHLQKRMHAGLKEIIIALNYNPEGEHMLSYLSALLRPLTEKHGVKISTLGRGLSTGTELEYSDVNTLKNALKNKQ